METVLELMKADLGITGSARDEYFKRMIDACKDEIVRRGVTLDESAADDAMLLSDYAAWSYRKRTESVPFPVNLEKRILNRKTRARANGND